MAGIVVSFDPYGRTGENTRTVTAMLRGFGRPACEPAIHVDDQVILASCGGRQPVWDERQRVCALFLGAMPGPDGGSPEETIISLYRERGEDFIEALDGGFALALWDAVGRRLLVGNDRFGLMPLYTTSMRGSTLWASSPKAMLSDPAYPARLNPAALADFLALNFFQADDTLLDGASELTPGTLAISEAGRTRTLRYWDFVLAEEETGRSLRSYVADATDVLRQSARRREAKDSPTGLLLSGGTGSRMALGVLDRRAVRGYTIGFAGSPDIVLARQVAERAEIAHRSFTVRPDALITYAREGIERCAEPVNCAEFPGLEAYGEIAAETGVLVTGTGGTPIFGHPVEEERELNPDTDFLERRVFSDEELARLLQPGWYRRIAGLARRRFHDDMTRSPSRHPSHRRDYWAFRQQQRRLATRLAQLFPDGLQFRPLFLDNEVVDFARSLPPSLRRGERSVYRRMLLTTVPELADLPVTTTGGIPFTFSRRRRYVYRQVAMLRRRLQRLLPVSKSGRRSPVEGQWLRGELSGWISDLLLDPRTLDRGLWRPEGMEELVADCLQGRRPAGMRKLLTVVSLELWCRRYFDGARETAAQGQVFG